MILALITLLSALSISAIAALYSLLGLAAIFSAAKIPVLLMGGVLEVGKLVTASWLYQNWRKTPYLLKSYLTGAVVVLIFITSMGIFGFLSKAHLDQTITSGDNSVEIAQIDQRIGREKRTIADAEKVIAQLDQAVQVLMDYDRIRGKDGAIAVRQSQAEERENLNTLIDNTMLKLDELENKKANLQKEQIQIEAEVGPLKYIAELIYGDEAKDHFDEAVRWVIILLIFVFDPLAVLLLIAANQSFREMKKVQIPAENITEIYADEIEEEPLKEQQPPIEPDTSETDSVEEPKEEIIQESSSSEVNEVKDIMTEDERELWEKFKSRKEWKEKNSGIVQHEYVEEDRKVEDKNWPGPGV